MKKVAHKHRDVALHSPLQQAKFFALAAELHYEIETVKNRAKNKFNRECFNDLRSSEISWLIEKLQHKIEKLKYVRNT